MKPAALAACALALASCASQAPLQRRPINPVRWGLAYHMDQAELVTGVSQLLHMSGQTDLVEDADAPLGVSVAHPGDMKAQMQASLAAIDDLLAEAGMDRSHLLSLRFYTTDMQACLDSYEIYAQWIEPSGVRPPQSMIGVAALVLPELLIEIEATAGR